MKEQQTRLSIKKITQICHFSNQILTPIDVLDIFRQNKDFEELINKFDLRIA